MPAIEIVNYQYFATVVDVYDGDSITANVDLGFNFFINNMKFRLTGIDTPEIRGDSKEEGLKVRDIVRSMILGKRVILQTERDHREKYGRWLCTVFIDGINLNQWLIENGHAKYYNE